MKYIITETQYRLIKEQSQPVKIELPKDKTTVDQYCKPIQVPKTYIENIPNDEIQDSVDRILNLMRRKIDQSLGKDPNYIYKKVSSKIESAIIPIIQSSIKNQALNMGGYVQYDMTNDAKKMVDVVYNTLNSEFNTFVNKNIARAFITPNNKGEIISEIKGYFDSIITVLTRLDSSGNMVFRNSANRFLQTLPDKGICKKVLVVKEDGYKITPYNPRINYFISPNYSRNEINYDSIIKPYYEKIIQLVNSLA